jgi:hypothetical protein
MGRQLLFNQGATMLTVTLSDPGSCVRKERIRLITPALETPYTCNGGVSKKLQSIRNNATRTDVYAPTMQQNLS